MAAAISGASVNPNQAFIDQRRKLLEEATDAGLKAHYQREIDLVMSWSNPAARNPSTFGPEPHQVASLPKHDYSSNAPAPAPAPPMKRNSSVNESSNSNPKPLTDHPFSTQPQIGKLSKAEADKMAIAVAEQLMKDFGLTKEQAAGIVGNLLHESDGMNANVNEYGSDHNWETFGRPNKTQFGYGWAQWTADRKENYLAFCAKNNLDPASPAANYAMLKHELLTYESATIPAIKAAQTPSEAAVIFRKIFERAAMPVDHSRMAAAGYIYNQIA